MLDIDLKKLKTFEAVARLRSFTAAAEELLIAQPSVSQHVQKLEESIGVPLLLRTRQGVELTDAGSIFLQEFYQTQTRFERALSAARSGAASGRTLRIGSPFQATARFLPSLIERFQDSNPGVRIQVVERSPSHIRKAVEIGELELGFGRLSPGLEVSGTESAGVLSEVVYTDGLMVAASSEHPICQKKSTSLEEASSYDWCLFDRSQTPEFCDFLSQCCRSRGVVPQIVGAWETFHALITTVAAGTSISILPGCFSHPPFPGIVFIPIEPIVEMDLVMYWSDQSSGSATTDFIEMIRAEQPSIQRLHQLL